MARRLGLASRASGRRSSDEKKTASNKWWGTRVARWLGLAWLGSASRPSSRRAKIKGDLGKHTKGRKM